jgi:DNA-directed RNA polymerase subunit L
MEIEFIQRKKNFLKLKVVGEDHTICNLIRKELFNHPSTSFAGYRKEHPLKDYSILVLRTRRKDTLLVLKKAIANAIKNLEALKKEIK